MCMCVCVCVRVRVAVSVCVCVCPHQPHLCRAPLVTHSRLLLTAALLLEVTMFVGQHVKDVPVGEPAWS